MDGKRVLKKNNRDRTKGAELSAADGQTARRGGRQAFLPLRLTAREKAILLIPALAAVLVVIFLVANQRENLRYTLTGTPTVYYNGGESELAEGTVLQRTGEGNTVANIGGIQRELTALPIYFPERNAFLLPNDMIYYDPRGTTIGRIEYFTEIRIDSHGMIYAVTDGKETRLQPGFLYDGKDFYVFLEPMSVTLNGYRKEVSAMSYVEAIYRGEIMVFDYESKAFLQEPTREAVTAEIETGDYTLSLLADSITNFQGGRRLLITRPDLLDPLT